MQGQFLLRYNIAMSKKYIADPNEHSVASANTEPPSETREELFTNAPELHADQSFENEMKVIRRAERKSQEKLAAADRAQQKAKAAAEKEAAAAELAKTQTLDPEKIEERIIEKARNENLSKLYPDPIPYRDEIEEKLKERDKDKLANEQPRAKLESVYNDKLHANIRNSLIIQVICFVLYSVSPFIILGNPGFLSLIPATLIIGTIYLLERGAKTCKNSKIPYEQRNSFIVASLLPALFIRTALATIIMTVSSRLPLVGSIAGTIAGYFIGSALHYNYLFRRGIESEPRMVLYNTLSFLIFQLLNFLPIIIALSAANVMALASSAMGIYGYAIGFIIFIIADGFAAKTSPGYYK